MATLKYEAVAVVGERDGKKQYQKVGAVFESDKGLSLKMDCVPVGGGWNGWVSFYPPKPKDGQQQAPAKPQSSKKMPPPDFDDDIGF